MVAEEAHVTQRASITLDRQPPVDRSQCSLVEAAAAAAAESLHLPKRAAVRVARFRELARLMGTFRATESTLAALTASLWRLLEPERKHMGVREYEQWGATRTCFREWLRKLQRCVDGRDLRRWLRQGRATDEAAPGGTAIRARGSFLIVFSGPAGRDDGLPAALRRRGAVVVEIDTKVGGADHDMTRGEVIEELMRRIRAHEFDGVFIATPCESYSVAHEPRLRTSAQPEGVTPVPPEWRRYLEKHNYLAAVSARLARAALENGVAVAIENPAHRGDQGSAAYWRRHHDHGSLWQMPVIEALQLRLQTFAQCSFGAPWQKWTSIAYSMNLEAEMGKLAGHGCPHGNVRHSMVAHGRLADGRSVANLAAAYPRAMSEFIAEALMSR